LLPILEILVGTAFVVLLAIFGSYKTNIAKIDATGGTIAHPISRFFTIKRTFDSSSNLTDEQKEILPDDFKFYPLGPNEIQYKGKTVVTQNEDRVPAKFYFNVIDPMPPYVGLGNLNVTVVEANAHWGFVVEPKEWNKMGFNDFVKWDNCNPEPRVEYAGSSFIPMALITENREKFREAQNAYDLEFEKSHDTAAAKRVYLKNVTLSEEDKTEFNVEWKATDHPEGYDVYEGGLDPASLAFEDGVIAPIDAGDETIIYADEDVKKLIEAQANATKEFTDQLKRDNLIGGTIKAEHKIEQGVVRVLEEAFDGLDDFSGGKAFKSVIFPDSCPTVTGIANDKVTAKDWISCGVGLVGSAGIAVLQSKLDNKLEKKAMATLTGAKLNDDIKNTGDAIKDLKRTAIRGQDELGELSDKISKKTKDLDALEKQKNKLKKEFTGGADIGFAVGFKALSVGVAAFSTFVNPPKDTPPQTVHLDGLESFWNQTVIVIDTTPPDVLVPEFEAVEVNNLVPQELQINPPLIFDVADPSPDLFHNFTDNPSDLDFDICHQKTGKCGWIPLGDDDFLEGTFPVNTVTTIEWFGSDFSENESPIRDQIVNVKLTGTNLVSVALNQTHQVGGFGFNPAEITIAAENPDNDPVKYLVESNPDEGVLKSPLDPVFQNKIRLTGDTGSLRGLSFVNPTNSSSPDFVYFPDSKNNRVMKIFTESGDSNGLGHVELGFTFSNGTEFPSGLLPLEISPKAITQVETASCPLTYLIADWNDEKIYNATLENCDENSSTGLVTGFFDVKGLFTDPQYLELDGTDLYVSDAGLGSIIKTTVADISSGNSLILPTDVLSLENNKAWVVDSGNNRIIEFDVTTNTSREKSFPNNLTPSGITANATHLFVSHESGKKITVVNQTDIDDSFEIPDTGNLNLGKSERITINEDILFVTDSKNDQIHILNTTGLIDSINGPSDNPGYFDDPIGISANGTNLFVADSGHHRIVKINQGGPFFEDDYTNSTGNWQTFGSDVTINGSSSTGVLKFMNVQSGSSATFSGAYTELGNSLPVRSWTASFTLETETNTDDSVGYIWLLTNQTMTNPDVDSINALGVRLDSSKLFIYQKNSTNSLVSSEGIPIENNTTYEISLTRNTEEQVKLVASSSGTELVPSPILNISKSIVDLHVLQHSNNIQEPIGDSLNFTIDDSIIEPVKFSWLGSCTSGLDCIDSIISDGFLCTDDTCNTDNSPGTENGQFNTPLGITHNGTNFFVTDAGNQRIQIFDTEGKFVKEFGDVTKFIFPAGVSLDDQEKIYVADNLGNALKVFEGDTPFDLIHEITTKKSQEDFLKIAKQFQLSIFDIQVDAVSMNPNTGDSWILGTSNQTKLFNLKNPSQVGNVIEGIDLESLGLVDPTYFAIDSMGKFLLIDRQKDGGSVIEFEIQNGEITNDVVTALGPLIQEPVGIEIENESGEDFVYISDWTQGQEKIVKFERNNIHNGAFDEPPEAIINISNLTQTPKDIGFVNAVNPCLDDGSHCDPPTDNRRITIADKDEFGPKIISIRTDMGIIDSKKIIEGNEVSIASIEYGIDSQENILFAIATNKTLFSYDPWVQPHELKKSLDFLSGSLNPDSFAFNPLPFGSKGNFTDGSNDLISPRGMAIGPIDNNLYVASMETDVIKKYNGTNGNFIENFVGDEFLDRPYGIAFHPDTNNLFVSNFGDGCIREYDGTSGEHLQNIQCERDWGMAAPKGIGFDSNGILYASANDQNSVIKFDLELDENDELKLPEQFISSDTGYLDSPDGLTFDNENNLYVVNPDEVLKFDSEGNFIEVFANSTIISNPIGLYFDQKNEFMYISNNIDKTISDDSIKKLDLDGNLISTISSKDVKSPYYITMDDFGNIFTGNELDGVIVHFGEVNDNIYVADWGDNINQRKIFAFTKNGTQINDKTINLKNTVVLTNPAGLAIDSNGNLYITDHNGTDGRIVVIDRVDETLLKEIPLSDIKLDRRGCTEIPGEDPPLCRFDDGEIVPLDEVNTSTISIIPKGLSINSANEMFLSDWQNNRIVRLSTDGDFIDLYKFNNTFAEPGDIAITLDQKEWVVGDNPGVVLDERKSNHKIRFSVLDKFSILEGNSTNEVKSLNYFSLMQVKRDFTDDIQSIDGLARCVVESCAPPNKQFNN